MIKALLIDLDGTLIDTIPALYQVYLNFLERYGIEGNREEFETLIGPSLEEIAAILKKKYKLTDSVKDLTTIYTSFVILQRFEGTILFPGVKECIEFAKQNHIKLALVTSGTQNLVKTCLEPHGIYEKFDLIVTSDDVDKAKPDPMIYKKALDKLGLDPKEVVAIEDSIAGVQSSSRANLFTLLFNPQLELYGIDSAVYKQVVGWDEILQWIKNSP